MAEDEVLLFIVTIAISLIGWSKWYFQILSASSRRSSGAKTIVCLAPFTAAAALYWVLTNFASFDVKDSPIYLLFYMVLGAAWTYLALYLFPYRGLSHRDDVGERENVAAAWAIAGSMIGVTLAFAGANIGDGPGWWVVIFCAGLSTIGFFIMWSLVNSFSSPLEAVTVDRDTASGIRFGALMLSAGIILGRAAAGNWVSPEEAFSTFIRLGWPSLILAFVGIMADRMFQPTPQKPSRAAVPFGLFPATMYVFCSATYVYSLGKW